MPITGLETYIKTVLKMPSEGMKSELITRLNNMSGLNGTPMSPLLTKWIQSRIGLFAVQKIQNYVAGGFSPDELRRFNGVFPDTFEGSVIRNELYDALNGGGVVPPIANFSGSPTTVYQGDTVNFTDLSTNTPTSWSWAFAGGTPATSTTQNPSVVYNTAGVYGVDLTATNAGGSDSESKPNYITVNYPYLLDLNPGAAAAYSVRRLSSTYTGAAIRVRRSSDNTEQDIGFSGVNLDETALTTFVGAGSGFVTKWYDQSGNGNTGNQTVAAQQPRIVNSGIIEIQSGKPTLQYLGNYFFNLTNTLSITASWSVFQTLGRANTGISMAGFGSNNVSGYTSLFFGNDLYYWDSSNGKKINAGILTNLKLITVYNGSSTAYVNNISQTTTNTQPGSNNNFTLIGKTGGANSNGYISEIIYYPTSQLSNNTGINTNITTYYSI
jgi:PKD repeat protein